MSFIYTQATFQSRLNAKIQNKIGMLVSAQETMNDAVREVNNDFDIRSTIRQSTLAPNLYNGIYQYTCPTDLKGFGIIDLPAQAKRADGEFNLVPSQTFATNKKSGDIAFDDYNGSRILMINSIVDSKSIVISELDSTTSASADGTAWQPVGDVTLSTILADTDDYIKGNGSLKFNINSGGTTTAGITHSNINFVDMTEYFGGNSSFFVWAKITSTTNLTSYTLRFGTDSSNYYYKTVTARADGTAFTTGWNLLKFDVASYSTTGTPTNTNIKYYSLYMNKDAAKISESDYKFDYLVLKRGVTTSVKYYSKYGWTNSSGTYIENSTATSDLLVADTDEFDLYLAKARQLAADELQFDANDIERYKKDYEDKLANYMMKHPSESKIFTYEYYEY